MRTIPIPRRTIALAAILCLGCALRLYDLDRHSLWFDEASSLLFAAPDQPLSVALERMASDVHPPLYYLVLRGWTRIVGTESDSALRLLSAMFSIAAFWMVYLVARKLFSDGPRQEAATLAAVTITALSPFQIWYARELRSYSLVTFLALVVTYEFLWICASKSSRLRTVLYGLSAGLLLYAHYLGIFLLAAHLVVLILPGSSRLVSRERRRAVLTRVLAGQAIAATLFLWWLPTFLGRSRDVSQHYWIPTPEFTDLLRTLVEFLMFNATFDVGAVGISAVLSLILCGFLAFFIAPHRTRIRQDSVASGTGNVAPPGQYWTFLLLWLLVPPLLSFFISLVGPKIFLTRTLSYCAPALYLLLAQLIAVRRWSLPIAFLTLFFTVHQLPWLFTRSQKQAWERAARYVTEHYREGDAFLFEDPGVRLPFERYFKEPGYRVETCAHDPGIARLWLIISMTKKRARDVLALPGCSRYTVRERRRLPGVVVLGLERREVPSPGAP